MNKSTWNNHRVVKHIDGSYGIHEAYYTDNNLDYITERALQPYGMTYGELKSDMDMFKEAFKRDVIDEAEFNKEHSILPNKELKKLMSNNSGLGDVESVKKYGINIEPPAFDYEEEQLKKLGELPHLHGDNFCGKCKGLRPTEEEQNKNNLYLISHRCFKYGKIVRHFDAHPQIYRCNDCINNVLPHLHGDS